MNQHPVNDYPPPPKKTNKTWMIVVLVLVILCGCCALSIAAGAGYFYLNPNMLQNMPGNDLSQSRAPQSGGAEAFQATQTAEVGAQSSIGANSIPFTLNVPDGVKVIEKGAFVAINENDPEVCTLYISFVLQSSNGIYKVNKDYKIWTFNSQDQGGKETLFETTSGSTSLLIVPIGQTASFFWKFGNPFASWNKPSKIEITLSPAELKSSEQKGLDTLNNSAFPNPYFTPGSADLTVGEKDANGLYKVEARGKFKNNLPFETFVVGLFVFYDASGNVVGMASSNCKEINKCNAMGSVTLPPGAEGEVNTVLPYRLKTPPVKVTLYQLLEYSITFSLEKIK